MSEKKEIPKKPDWVLIHRGTHRQLGDKEESKSLNDYNYYEWLYSVNKDRTNSKLEIQQVSMGDGKRKSEGKPVVFENIYAILNRHQCRNFVRNYKK